MVLFTKKKYDFIKNKKTNWLDDSFSPGFLPTIQLNIVGLYFHDGKLANTHSLGETAVL